MDQQTIFCSKVKQYVFQVTTGEIRILSNSDFRVISKWVSGENGRINICACFFDQIIVGTGSGKVIFFHMIADISLNHHANADYLFRGGSEVRSYF